MESLRVVGCCPPIQDPDVPPIALSSLRECTLSGEGTASMIRFVAVPQTALVYLGRPCNIIWPSLPLFSQNSVAPALRIPGELSAISFWVNGDLAWLQAKNIHGGVLSVEVGGLDVLSGDQLAVVNFIRRSLECWSTCPGLRTAKEFTLRMDRRRRWRHKELECGAGGLVGLISNLPGIEGATLDGLRQLELVSIVEFLASEPNPQCPNLKRLDIVSPRVHNPRSLLAAIGRFLAWRKAAGAPLQSVTLKLKCEMLISAVEHSAFLTSWEALVGGGVRLEYERKLPRRRRDGGYPEGDEGEDEDADEEDYGSEDEGEEEGAEGGGEDGVGDPAGWDGWPENWPKTLQEMRGQ